MGWGAADGGCGGRYTLRLLRHLARHTRLPLKKPLAPEGYREAARCSLDRDVGFLGHPEVLLALIKHPELSKLFVVVFFGYQGFEGDATPLPFFLSLSAILNLCDV